MAAVPPDKARDSGVALMMGLEMVDIFNVFAQRRKSLFEFYNVFAQRNEVIHD